MYLEHDIMVNSLNSYYKADLLYVKMDQHTLKLNPVSSYSYIDVLIQAHDKVLRCGTMFNVLYFLLIYRTCR